MKTSPPPPRSEWDFREFIELEPENRWKLEQCYLWEYYREVYRRRFSFKKAVDNWRLEHPLTDAGFHGEPFNVATIYFAPEEDKISPLWFVAFPDWPERPYLEANVWNPNAEWIQYPKEGHGLQIDLEDFIKHEIHNLSSDWQWEYWPAGSVLAASASAIVALHIDWSRPLDDIKRQMGEWLSWAHKHVANRPEKLKLGKGHPTSRAQARLKWLTAYRLLLKNKRRYKEAVAIYENVYPEGLYCEQADWIKAAKRAKELIESMGQSCEVDT